MRLTGYGLLILILSFVPRDRYSKLWLLYGGFTLVLAKLKQGDLFFRVTLPNYDAGNSSVVTVDISNVSWQELDTFEGGKLLRKE